MAPIITGEVLEGYLNCKLKGYLRLKGERGTKSDYETLMTALRDDLRAGAYEKLLARHAGADVLRGVKIETSTLKRGPHSSSMRSSRTRPSRSTSMA